MPLGRARDVVGVVHLTVWRKAGLPSRQGRRTVKFGCEGTVKMVHFAELTAWHQLQRCLRLHLTLEAEGLVTDARALDFASDACAAGPSRTPAPEEVAVAVAGYEGWPTEMKGASACKGEARGRGVSTLQAIVGSRHTCKCSADGCLDGVRLCTILLASTAASPTALASSSVALIIAASMAGFSASAPWGRERRVGPGTWGSCRGTSEVEWLRARAGERGAEATLPPLPRLAVSESGCW